MLINSKPRSIIKLRIISLNDINSRYIRLVSLSIFKFFIVIIYIIYFISLSIKTKIILYILLIYESLIDNIFVIKFIIIV